MSEFNKEACVAVDAMGADKGVSEVVSGICEVLKADRGALKIIAVGDEAQVSEEFKKRGFLKDPRLTIYHASQVIEMHEKPILAMRAKRDSSMMRAIDLAKSGAAHAVLSCGNTGALMAGGTIKLRTMQGIERPALATVIPADNRNFVLVDVGANPDPKPSHLLDNAILGANYARAATGVRNPKVGLLCNGTEEGKGNVLTQNAHLLMKESADVINYAGLVEGFQLFQGDCDVIVCDGFTGNVVLKSVEGVAKMIKGMLNEELKRTWLRKFGAIISIGAFKAMKRRIPVEKFSGAPLLGLDKLVVKGHGSSSNLQIAGALSIAIQCIRRDLNNQIADDVLKIRAITDAKKSNSDLENLNEE